MQKANKEEMEEAQRQLEEYRRTQIAYLSQEDRNIDFSNCDKPKIEENDTNRSTE